jgi:adenylate cyclase class 2
MTYEVELKFPLVDTHAVLATLTELGAATAPPIEQVDRYFNHPGRDFKVSNEAFRIRSVGDWNCLTYKGPVIDAATKTRREIEIAFAEGPLASTQMIELLTALGFRPVREVRKTRTPWSLQWNGRTFDVALDVVPRVGTFLEIELIADEETRHAARDAILALAARLNLSQPEPRSYLELVLAADDAKGQSPMTHDACL